MFKDRYNKLKEKFNTDPFGEAVKYLIGFLSLLLVCFGLLVFVLNLQDKLILQMRSEIYQLHSYQVDLELKQQYDSVQLYNDLVDQNIRVMELEYSMESIQRKVEVLDASINADTKRRAQRNVVIAAIKEMLPPHNPIDECPSKPGPGEIWAIANAIVDNAEEYAVPASLIAGVIRQESAFCNKAISHADARGYMQLLPSTAAFVSAQLLTKNGRTLYTWKGADNIQLGTAYLAQLLLEFDHNEELAVRAYNAGPGHVKEVLAEVADKNYCKDKKTGELFETRWHCETYDYAPRVLAFKQEFERLGL